jgi:hypothetical protein
LILRTVTAQANRPVQRLSQSIRLVRVLQRWLILALRVLALRVLTLRVLALRVLALRVLALRLLALDVLALGISQVVNWKGKMNDTLLY